MGSKLSETSLICDCLYSTFILTVYLGKKFYIRNDFPQNFEGIVSLSYNLHGFYQEIWWYFDSQFFVCDLWFSLLQKEFGSSLSAQCSEILWYYALIWAFFTHFLEYLWVFITQYLDPSVRGNFLDLFLW